MTQRAFIHISGTLACLLVFSPLSFAQAPVKAPADPDDVLTPGAVAPPADADWMAPAAAPPAPAAPAAAPAEAAPVAAADDYAAPDSATAEVSAETPAPVAEAEAAAEGAANAEGSAATDTATEDQYLPEDVSLHLNALPSLSGPVGLLRVSTADTGPVNHLRLGFRGEYFSGTDVLIKGDEDVRIQGTFVLGYTPIEHLELFGGFFGSSNRNRRVCVGGTCISEANRVDPEIIKSIGDLMLGGKYAQPIGTGVSIGGELGLRLLSSVAGLSLDPSATSLWFKGIASFDFKERSQIPLRTHINLGYYIDNSSSLQSYKGITQSSELVSSFAFGIAQNRFRSAIGFDVPLDPVAPNLFVLPFAEYHLEAVTADANPAFAEYDTPRCSGSKCINNRDQQWATVGVRALLPSGFALELAVDIGVRSVGFPYGTPMAPYNIVLGAMLPIDLNRIGRTRIITRKVEAQDESPAAAGATNEGVATGSVVSANGGVPVSGAIIGVAGRPQSRVATDPDGAFQSHPLPPGEVDLEITATGFAPQTVRAEIAAAMSTEVRVALVPSITDVELSGKITSTTGSGVAGDVIFSGPSDAKATADSSGAFTIRVAPGVYQVRTDAGGHLQREMQVTVRDGYTQPVAFVLRKRVGRGTVSVGKKALSGGGGIAFKGETEQLTPKAEAVLDEVVDALVTHPGIRRLEIQTHHDSGIGPDKAMALTEKQGEAIVSYLRKQGIDPGRMNVAPKGASQPKVPNIGEKNRRKNRRVELRLL